MPKLALFVCLLIWLAWLPCFSRAQSPSVSPLTGPPDLETILAIPKALKTVLAQALSSLSGFSQWLKGWEEAGIVAKLQAEASGWWLELKEFFLGRVRIFPEEFKKEKLEMAESFRQILPQFVKDFWKK